MGRENETRVRNREISRTGVRRLVRSYTPGGRDRMSTELKTERKLCRLVRRLVRRVKKRTIPSRGVVAVIAFGSSGFGCSR